MSDETAPGAQDTAPGAQDTAPGAQDTAPGAPETAPGAGAVAAGYDVVIIGGAIIGSSIAWNLSAIDGFDGSILVIDRDLTYSACSTSHTNSCMRQQFSNPLNVRISQFAADFVRNFRDELGGDPEIPDIFVNHFGYLYLAGEDGFAETLRANQAVQAELGAGTRIMSPNEIKTAYPFYNVDDIICGSHNLVDEGYFDSGTMFDQWRRTARRNGVTYHQDEVVGFDVGPTGVGSVRLASGHSIGCGTVVNAAGPEASTIAAMAGIDLPVEARKRYTYIFEAAESLGMDLPLTIDPSGIHVRSEGDAFMTGCAPDPDPAVDPDDYTMDRDIFEERIWPVLVHRIPAFERIKVTSSWAGHYAHNSVDHNVIVGPHSRLSNFVFANGFSGHGLQQSPAIGRGVAELIAHGEYRSIDLTPLGHHRIEAGEPFVETAVI